MILIEGEVISKFVNFIKKSSEVMQLPTAANVAMGDGSLYLVTRGNCVGWKCGPSVASRHYSGRWSYRCLPDSVDSGS